MLRCLHDFGDEVYINYTVERTTFVPITIDVRLEGQTSKGFRCRNGNITDSVTGMVIVRVLFESNCLDPVVGINMAAMVNLTVEISVNVTDTFLCNTFAIGPQSEYNCCMFVGEGCYICTYVRTNQSFAMHIQRWRMCGG